MTESQEEPITKPFSFSPISCSNPLCTHTELLALGFFNTFWLCFICEGCGGVEMLKVKFMDEPKIKKKPLGVG